MNEYNICKEEDNVSISIGECSYIKAFMTIFIDDDVIDSPFKKIEDAELFAEIIVKLLKVISDDIKRP